MNRIGKQKPPATAGGSDWCSGGDSNPHGLLHTPLKRARLPITPPEQFDLSKIYFFVGALAAGLLAARTFAGVFPVAEFDFGNTVIGAAFASAGAAAFALVSAGAAALASDVLAFVFEFAVSAGASGLLDRTEILPVNAGMARNRADSMNVVAAMIVTFDKTVAVPRGAKAELDTLLVKSAPASVFPGCSKTALTSTIHDVKKIA